MTLAIRFLPNAGRKFIYASGATVDIPFPDAETIHSDQATRLMVIGTTAERPVNDPGRINWPPSVMYDSTLSSDIFLV